MSIATDVRKLASLNNRIKALEAERRALYSSYELVGAGAVDVLNREYTSHMEKQLQKESEEA